MKRKKSHRPKKNSSHFLFRYSKIAFFGVLLLFGLAASVYALFQKTELSSQASGPNWVSGTQTITFQNGNQGYQGTRDSFVLENKKNRNYKRNKQLRVDGTQTAVSLIEFILPEIPTGAVINEAKVIVTALGSNTDSLESISAHTVLKEWKENKVTWERSDRKNNQDVLWTEAGLQAAGVDISTAPIGNLRLVADSAYSVDVTSVINSWVQNPDTNFGIVLKSNTGAQDVYRFASSENNNKAKRPSLVISYTLPENTPTPTPLATPNPTPQPTPTATPSPTNSPNNGTRDWSSVNSWTYQLSGYQNGNLHQIKNSDFDLAVIDLARDGYTDYFTNAEITAVKNTGKYVLAYFEIGAIENYRPEWNSTPDAVKLCSVEGWSDEKYTKFWDSRWWPVVQSRIDQALLAGYDGAYLDMIVTYEELYYNCRSKIDGKSDTDLAAEMIKLIEKVAVYAQTQSPYKNPDFKVVPQNAPELYTWDFSGNQYASQNLNQKYIQAIDGLGMEELFFQTTDKACNASWCEDNRRNAAAIRQQNKLVLTVDYANRASNISNAYSRSRGYGFVPYASVVALDIMRINE